MDNALHRHPLYALRAGLPYQKAPAKCQNDEMFEPYSCRLCASSDTCVVEFGAMCLLSAAGDIDLRKITVQRANG